MERTIRVHGGEGNSDLEVANSSIERRPAEFTGR